MKFATSNPNKFAEAKETLGDFLEQIDIDVDEIQSTDVVEVVKHKAKAAYALAWEAVIVEDTGLYFEVWNWLPGALIKWFIKNIWREWLLKMLENFPLRDAKAICCIGYFDGEKYIFATGEIEWTIAPTVMGETTFGRDPIFIPKWHERSFAQMSMEEKNTISHRGQAFREFKELLIINNI